MESLSSPRGEEVKETVRVTYVGMLLRKTPFWFAGTD